MKTKVCTILVLLALIVWTSYCLIRLAYEDGVPWQLLSIFAMLLAGLVCVFGGVIVILTRHAEFVRTFIRQDTVDEVIERLRERVRETYQVEQDMQAKGVFASEFTVAAKKGLRKRVERAAWLARENKFRASDRIPTGPLVTDDLT